MTTNQSNGEAMLPDEHLERAWDLVNRWRTDRRLLDQRYVTTEDCRVLAEWIAARQRTTEESILRDWAVCILHGLVERSHRCRDYDGEEFGASIHYIKDIVRESTLTTAQSQLAGEVLAELSPRANPCEAGVFSRLRDLFVRLGVKLEEK